MTQITRIMSWPDSQVTNALYKCACRDKALPCLYRSPELTAGIIIESTAQSPIPNHHSQITSNPNFKSANY